MSVSKGFPTNSRLLSIYCNGFTGDFPVRKISVFSLISYQLQHTF